MTDNRLSALAIVLLIILDDQLRIFVTVTPRCVCALCVCVCVCVCVGRSVIKGRRLKKEQDDCADFVVFQIITYSVLIKLN